jgi:3-isopropylmalate/(R)-2-methylmalate dehydratase small subunit
MPKEKFNILESSCVPFPLENIDTDQIIPARFLSATTREGFGDNLFCDWRYDKSGNINKDFILNNPKYSGKILVAGKNFGCGSSREHAVWAVAGYGFKAVVSSFFADIFKNNSLNNGLLPVVVPQDFLENLLSLINHNPETTVRINLNNQTLEIPKESLSVSFEINAYKKECLLNGLDDIDYLLSLKEMISGYEFRNKLKL